MLSFPAGAKFNFWTNRRSGSPGERTFLDEDLVTVSSARPESNERSSKGLILSDSDPPREPLIALPMSTNLFPKVCASPSISEYRNSSLTTLICTKLGFTFLANTYDSKIGSCSAPTVTSITILSTIEVIRPAPTHGSAFALGFFPRSTVLHFRICNSIGKSAEIG